MILSEIYGREPINGYRSGHGVEEGLPLPNLLVGIELEIENFRAVEGEQVFGGFRFTTDGSLRHSEKGIGIEAISRPVAIKHLRKLLNAFFGKFNITSENYTERCSTHIHVNIDDLTVQQIACLCLVYQTAERLLFTFIGEDRDKNIFCVPWNQSNLSYNIVSKIVDGEAPSSFKRWQKYSAMNLIPAATQGSLEFRHLGGTCDLDKIMNWVCIIAKMVEYATKVDLTEAKAHILQMNTVSNYYEWMNMVFGRYAPLLQVDKFEAALSSGVIDSKLMLIKETPNAAAAWRQMIEETNILRGWDAVPAAPRAEVFARHPGRDPIIRTTNPRVRVIPNQLTPQQVLDRRLQQLDDEAEHALQAERENPDEEEGSF